MRNGNADIAELDGDELVAAAIGADGDSDASARMVGELQRRGTPEVPEAAERLTRSADARERLLGAWILGQIAYPNPDMEPFPVIRARVVARLLELLHEDPDPETVRAAISGLGLLSALGALDDVLASAAHPEAETCRAVAGAFDCSARWGELGSTLAAFLRADLESQLGAVEEQLDGDLAGAARVFRQDIADAAA